jgi:hypothetical protein
MEYLFLYFLFPLSLSSAGSAAEDHIYFYYNTKKGNYPFKENKSAHPNKMTLSMSTPFIVPFFGLSFTPKARRLFFLRETGYPGPDGDQLPLDPSSGKAFKLLKHGIL